MNRIANYLAASALVVAPLFAVSASATVLYAVHGINAKDLYPPADEEALPVDITLVNPDGTEFVCLPGVEFMDPGTRLDVDQVGEYEVKIALAAGVGSTCGTGTPGIADTVNVSGVGNAIILLHLNASNTPVVRKYSLPNHPHSSTQAVVSVIHAAVAPPLSITIDGDENDNQDQIYTFPNVRNGEQTFPLTVREGTYSVRLIADGDHVLKERVSVSFGMYNVFIAVGAVYRQIFEVFRAP